MLAHAHPIIERLQSKMEIFIGLDFHDHQTAIPAHSQQVEYGAIGRGKCGHLGVHRLRLDHGVNRIGRSSQHGFQPAFRLLAIERVAFIATGPPAGDEFGHHFAQLWRGLQCQLSRVGAAAKQNFFRAGKTVFGGTGAHSRKLQAVPQQADLAAAAKDDFHFRNCMGRKEGTHTLDRGMKTLFGGRDVGCVEQAGFKISLVAEFSLIQLLGCFIQLV